MLVTIRHPFVIAPFVIQVPDARGCLRRHLPVNGKGVRLVHPISVITRLDVTLVQFPALEAGNKSLPHPSEAAWSEQVALFVPSVKITDHRHQFGIGRPDGETRSSLPIDSPQVRSQFHVQPVMRSLVEKVNVVLRQHRNIIPYGKDFTRRSACLRGVVFRHIHQSSFPRLAFLRTSSISRTFGIPMICRRVYFALRRQFGRSSHVPGTFCGCFSNHKSSRLTMTILLRPLPRYFNEAFSTSAIGGSRRLSAFGHRNFASASLNLRRLFNSISAPFLSSNPRATRS